MTWLSTPPIRISPSEAPMRRPESSSSRPASFWILTSWSSIAKCSSIFWAASFVEGHERFHEQTGLFQRLGILRLLHDMAEQQSKVLINFFSAFGIRNFGFQHLDEGLLFFKTLLI